MATLEDWKRQVAERLALRSEPNKEQAPQPMRKLDDCPVCGTVDPEDHLTSCTHPMSKRSNGRARTKKPGPYANIQKQDWLWVTLTGEPPKTLTTLACDHNPGVWSLQPDLATGDMIFRCKCHVWCKVTQETMKKDDIVKEVWMLFKKAPPYNLRSGVKEEDWI